MIAQLRGRVVASTLDAVVLDVAGVGYRVRIAPGTRTGPLGDELTLHTHLAVRDDAMTLYGFTEPAGRDLFETLLTVTGVGPKVALAALGALGAEGLRRAVVTEDVTALTVVPGVGKKGAQRMILELREKLGAVGEQGLPAAASTNGHDPRGEVREALAGLGYAPAEIHRVLPDGEDGEDTPEDLLRQALRQLATGS